MKCTLRVQVKMCERLLEIIQPLIVLKTNTYLVPGFVKTRASEYSLFRHDVSWKVFGPDINIWKYLIAKRKIFQKNQSTIIARMRTSSSWKTRVSPSPLLYPSCPTRVHNVRRHSVTETTWVWLRRTRRVAWRTLVHSLWTSHPARALINHYPYDVTCTAQHHNTLVVGNDGGGNNISFVRDDI